MKVLCKRLLLWRASCPHGHACRILLHVAASYRRKNKTKIQQDYTTDGIKRECVLLVRWAVSLIPMRIHAFCFGLV